MKAVEGLEQQADYALLGKPMWHFHVYRLLQIGVKKRVHDVQLFDFQVVDSSESEQNPNGHSFSNGGVDLVVVYPLALPMTTDHPSSLIFSISFDLEHPFAR